MKSLTGCDFILSPRMLRVSTLEKKTFDFTIKAVGFPYRWGLEALASRDHTLAGSLGGVPPEQKMLKGHLPRVIYHQVYLYTKKHVSGYWDGQVPALRV